MADASGLEQTIGAVRKEVWVVYDQYKGYQQKVLEVVDTGKAHAECECGTTLTIVLNVYFAIGGQVDVVRNHILRL